MCDACLAGLGGAGEAAVDREPAVRQDRSFIDLDQLVEPVAGPVPGAPCAT